MSGKGHQAARTQADAAQREEETLRARWESTQESFRERFDEPIERATRITKQTLAWFPVRVWRHFLQHNGFLLAAGVSYQALFAFFAVMYVAFAVVGLWLGGNEAAVTAMINVINTYVPGLIGTDGQPGLFTEQDVQTIAIDSSGVLAITGLIALGTAIWTAIGFITFLRRAVRDIFALAPDRRSYILLKSRDFLAAIVFGTAIVAGGALNAVGVWALSWLGGLLGLDGSALSTIAVRLGSVLVSLIINVAALAALFRFLTGTQLRWRRIWPGSILGGAALTVLQLGAGVLLLYTPSNPLLATFAIFVGLLLWFRLAGIVMLVAGAWIAVSASDRDVPLVPITEAERIAAEHRALLVAAQVRLRTAREARTSAPWYRVWAADRAVHAAQTELAQVEAAAPAPIEHGNVSR
ncbi:YihY/virulence factor BrkB family protein [Microbacterium awajiense]|uniref:YihY/virulence factor BrkB family protein n=1 Tax=Microbacterium awajiense TaxID=415214 RepID=UPI0031D36FD6